MPTTDLLPVETATAAREPRGNGVSAAGYGAPASSYLNSIKSALGWGPADPSGEPARMAETLPTPTAPSIFDRTAPGQVRSVAAANATRPILPVNGGVRPSPTSR
jgi:hypothetical protein